jgi:type II secretory pathway component PulF
MSLALLMIVSLLLVFVMPKLMSIFHDFGLRLPYASRLLLGTGQTLFGGWTFVAVPGLLVLAMATAFRGAFGAGDRAGRRLAWIDRLLWRLPVAHAMQRDEGLADACATIADALRTGLPLPRAIDEAARLRINRVLRDRLVLWRGGLEEGLRADDAARRAKLPALLCGMVASGRGGEPAEAMEFLAAYYGGRFSRARELLRAATVPALALLFGGLILFLAAGMYTPIIQMMDFLSENALKVSR